MSPTRASNFSRPTALLAVVGLAAFSILGAGCGSTVIDDVKAEDTLQASLEESLERTISTVDCPSDQDVTAGARFDCSIEFGNGDRATANLEILNDAADVGVVGLKANE